MFGLIFITVITICHFYVFWRAASVPFVQRHISSRNLSTICLLLWLLFVAGRLYGQSHDTTLSHWLEMGAMTWMGTLFFSPAVNWRWNC